jgi:hypothetical protein
VIALLAAVVTVAVGGGRVVTSIPVNLDRDAHRELVQTVEVTRPNPYGGTEPLHRRFVRVVDVSGGRTVATRVSPVLDYVTATVAGSLAPPFRRGIWYDGSTGNGGAAPRAFGLVTWTGGRAHALWRYASASSSLGKRYDGAGAGLFQDSTRGGPGPEIKLEEGVHRAGDPACCPYAEQISLYRLNASGTAYRLYSRRIVRR